MLNYKLIPHTADVRLKVEGSTLQELFKAALQGMASIIKKDFKKYALTQCEFINIRSEDITTLLVDFLSNVLTKSCTSATVFYEVEFTQISPISLSAKLRGAFIKKFDKDIKAVTYHEANVIKNKTGNLETVIVFDI